MYNINSKYVHDDIERIMQMRKLIWKIMHQIFIEP